MTLTFDKSLEVQYRVVDDVVPGIRRVVAENPGPYTFKGTATFIVGSGDVTIIDPGPADERHINAIMDAIKGETIERILVTHTHPDHSPGVRLLLDRCNATVYGHGPHPVPSAEAEAAYAEIPDPKNDAKDDAKNDAKDNAETNSEDKKEAESEAQGDRAFAPHVAVRHGDVIGSGATAFEAVHTPGHLANHVCFALSDRRILFTGDHVMGWSTSVISPPGGDLSQYLQSLNLLLLRNDLTFIPTHGSPIVDPKPYVEGLIAHRNDRTAQIIDRLRVAPHTVREIVAALYVGLDERLVRAAGRSVLAHLDALRKAGDVVAPADDPVTPWIARTYQLT